MRRHFRNLESALELYRTVQSERRGHARCRRVRHRRARRNCRLHRGAV